MFFAVQVSGLVLNLDPLHLLFNGICEWLSELIILAALPKDVMGVTSCSRASRVIADISCGQLSAVQPVRGADAASYDCLQLSFVLWAELVGDADILSPWFLILLFLIFCC